MSFAKRREQDLIGECELEGDTLYGIHTYRALQNFSLSGKRIHVELIRAYALVKLACIKTNADLGVWSDRNVSAALEKAAEELLSGELDNHIMVDALQGGAGTSTNMNINEVLANRALELLGKEKGDYAYISPLDDVNLHQSTNDTYPTALRLAAIRMLRKLEGELVALQEAFQAKEKEFADVVKVGRTELQDAVLTTLGREMSAYAEALSRDRWRIYKCEERLRVVNLGGTAIGTGIGAPRQFIFSVVEKLRELTGISFARAENLVEATQNADVFVEVSGNLKALAVSLFKSASDLRLLSSGPESGFGELKLPELQSGSSIMPGKVNPVIPEAVSQSALLVMGYDQTISCAAALGNLELNQFMPLIAHCLLESLNLLTRSCCIFREHCVTGLTANREACARHVGNSTALATALVAVLGYDRVAQLIKEAKESGIGIKEQVLKDSLLTESEYEALLSPEAVMRLGSA